MRTKKADVPPTDDADKCQTCLGFGYRVAIGSNSTVSVNAAKASGTAIKGRQVLCLSCNEVPPNVIKEPRNARRR